MVDSDTVYLDEILLAFARCIGFPSEVRIRDVKDLIFNDRGRSIGGKLDLSSFMNSIQGTMERSARNREHNHPPYYFYGVRRGVYELSEEGQIRLSQLNAQSAETRKQELLADQRAFLSNRNPSAEPPEQVEFNGRRFVRDNRTVRKLKEIYKYSCQVCGITIATVDCALFDDCGYAEVHHIRPLGSGHNGPDIRGNMVVVCPNHHAAFDLGTMAINPESLKIYRLDPYNGLYEMELLRREDGHDFNADCLKYSWGIWMQMLKENNLDIRETLTD